MYEGDVNIPVPMWSRTSAIADPENGYANPQNCAPLPLAVVARSVRRVIGTSDRGTVSGGPATGCTFTFTPHFVIRQLSGGSAPVRTPTFNPAFEFNSFELYLEDSASARVRRTSRGGGWRRATLKASHFRFGHYSNGQSGCLYTNQEPESCSTIPGLPEELNKTDGSFSTHYVEMGNTVGLVHYGDNGVERRLTAGTAALRWNPPGLAPIGGMNDELARTYGRWSVSSGVMIRSRQPKSWLFGYRMTTTLSVEGECALGRRSPYQPCRASAEGALAFPALYGVGISARYVTGWDYYNVGFGDRMRNPGGWRPMIGIVIDHTLPIRMRSGATGPGQ